MTSTLHATPYNLDAAGFYFTSIDDYTDKSSNHFDHYGNLVEEYEIQFIDGEDAQLFASCQINQSNLNTWFDDIECLADYEKVSLYYLISVAGYSLNNALDKLDEPSIMQCDLKDAAEELFDECWLPNIPESIRAYIDYDRFARDCELGGDMAEFEFNCNTYTCTNVNGL